LKKLYPEDYIVIVFSVIIIPLQIYFITINTGFSAIIGFIVLILLIALNFKYNNHVIKFLRSYYHIPYYGIIFTAFQTFIHKVNPNDFDLTLLKIDLAVFGFDVTRWFEQYISGWLTEVLTLSYFSYYVLPTLTFLILFFSKDTESFIRTRKYLLSIVTGWYAAFIFYYLMPAAGPDIAFPQHYSIPLMGLSPVTNSYLQTLSEYLKESSVRNTFPSMHFGIILISNYFAFIYKRKYFWLCTLPLGTLLGIATVYLRQHYLIDLAGSVPMAIFSIYLSSLLINKKGH